MWAIMELSAFSLPSIAFFNPSYVNTISVVIVSVPNTSGHLRNDERNSKLGTAR